MLGKKKYTLISFFVSICCLFSTFILTNCIPKVFAFETFTDVLEDTYYYESVTRMSEKGIITGYPEGDFRPENSVTVAEVLTLIFRNANINFDNSSEESLYWYSDVMSRAKSLGVISEDVQPNDYVNRLDVGKYIIEAYRLDTSKGSGKNVFSDTDSKVAKTMYAYNIFVGVPSDLGLLYMPDSEITRADICVVLYRLHNTLTSPLAGVYTQNGVVVNSNPTSYWDFKLLLKTVNAKDNFVIVVPYNIDLSNTDAYIRIKKSCQKAFEYNFVTYPETFGFIPNITVRTKIMTDKLGYIIVTMFNYDIETYKLSYYIDEFNNEADRVITELKESGKLDDEFTDLEKVKVLFEYVVTHTRYAEAKNVTALSYTGYGAANQHLAVCQGYVAFFNKLCQNIGIVSEGVSGISRVTDEEHTWSKLYINGKWHYFDTTYADGKIEDGDSYCNFAYFDVPYEILMTDRVVDDICK